MVKVTDDTNIPCNKRWKFKHILIWEQHHKKKVPNGCIVIFKDGNNTNFDIGKFTYDFKKPEFCACIMERITGKGKLTEMYAKSAQLLTFGK